MEPDLAHRLKNYLFGAGGILSAGIDFHAAASSLMFWCQVIAAVGGAVLVLRQLYRDYKKHG